VNGNFDFLTQDLPDVRGGAIRRAQHLGQISNPRGDWLGWRPVVRRVRIFVRPMQNQQRSGLEGVEKRVS